MQINCFSAVLKYKIWFTPIVRDACSKSGRIPAWNKSHIFCQSMLYLWFCIVCVVQNIFLLKHEETGRMEYRDLLFLQEKFQAKYWESIKEKKGKNSGFFSFQSSSGNWLMKPVCSRYKGPNLQLILNSKLLLLKTRKRKGTEN